MEAFDFNDEPRREFVSGDLRGQRLFPAAAAYHVDGGGIIINVLLQRLAFTPEGVCRLSGKITFDVIIVVGLDVFVCALRAGDSSLDFVLELFFVTGIELLNDSPDVEEQVLLGGPRVVSSSWSYFATCTLYVLLDLLFKDVNSSGRAPQ